MFLRKKASGYYLSIDAYPLFNLEKVLYQTLYKTELHWRRTLLHWNNSQHLGQIQSVRNIKIIKQII